MALPESTPDWTDNGDFGRVLFFVGRENGLRDALKDVFSPAALGLGVFGILGAAAYYALKDDVLPVPTLTRAKTIHLKEVLTAHSKSQESEARVSGLNQKKENPQDLLLVLGPPSADRLELDSFQLFNRIFGQPLEGKFERVGLVKLRKGNFIAIDGMISSFLDLDPFAPQDSDYPTQSFHLGLLQAIDLEAKITVLVMDYLPKLHLLNNSTEAVGALSLFGNIGASTVVLLTGVDASNKEFFQRRSDALKELVPNVSVIGTSSPKSLTAEQIREIRRFAGISEDLIQSIGDEASPAQKSVQPVQSQDSTPGAADERECPYCAELIKRKAILCRYCRSSVEPMPSE